MPGDHARLSASAAGRWLNCPGSVALTADLPDTAGEAAQEGALAHAICELRLRKHFIEPMGVRTYNSRLKKLQSEPLYQPEMLECAETYLDTVNELVLEREGRPHVALEHRLDLSAYVPEGFGTADCILIGNGILDIVDYKHGKGHAVNAERNPQMMLYALGALCEYGLIYSIDIVRLTIVQPRNGGVNTWTTEREWLEGWGEEIKPIAKAAYDGTGEVVPGSWCETGFCKICATCRKRAEVLCFSDFAEPLPLPPTLTDAELGAVLERALHVESWVTKLQDYALSTILNGGSIPGWKAVEGRSNRVITDVDAAFKRLEDGGIAEAMLYERKPLGITALERLVGKKKLSDLLADYIQKPPGKPTLAAADDPRSDYQTHTAEDDFGVKEKETNNE